jgi:hypothetical protein
MTQRSGVNACDGTEAAVGVRANSYLQARLIARKHILPVMDEQKRPDALGLRTGQRLFNPVAPHVDALGLDDALKSVVHVCGRTRILGIFTEKIKRKTD